ncbi:MAG: DUF1049 domain-containing protein [Candidatus Desulfofervidaceae bacterium]|nr:DUF1049 domain-containing protein [Candidatus Desulfofervidaceae bacterium]MDL1970087.1 lipopolysaccharide assembly protein LapA domain-containing protein [Candidatus Desulfofervidaceae bacterium]
MRWFKAIFWAAFFGIVLIFVVQNLEILNQTAQLNLDFYFTTLSFSLKLYLFLILTFLMGVFFGIVYTFKNWFKKRMELREKEKEIKKLKEELKSLRNLPITEEKLKGT